MESLSSVELNYLVYRYLKESGLLHSAYTFGLETRMSECPIDGDTVPTGSLVKFVQKGLEYVEMEANLSTSKTDQDKDLLFIPIPPLDLITKDVNGLRQMLTERRKGQRKYNIMIVNRQHESKSKRVSEKKTQNNDKEHKTDIRRHISDWGNQDLKRVQKKRSCRKGRDKGKVNPCKDSAGTEIITAQKDKATDTHKETKIHGGPQPTDNSTPSISGVPGVDVMFLEGHAHEVYACAWSPSGSLLASGSGDSTVRIWRVPDRITGGMLGFFYPDVRVLDHAKSNTNDRKLDVTSLDWNFDGSLLATGCLDGQARIWTSDGELKSTLRKHKEAIFDIKWNKKGDYIITGSSDITAIVWDVKKNQIKQQFEFHSGPALDSDWRDNVSFATSTDTTIQFCRIGMKCTLKTFYGHKGEVNTVKWDPSGSLLASSSDDNTAKVWSLKQDNCIQDLRGHTKEVYTIRWSPTGQGTINPNKQVVLASASYDSTVKTWDVEQGKLLCNLNGHRDAVFSIAFSPDGEYLASGSKDGSICIWSLKIGKMVKSYSGGGSIFEVCWNKEGNKVAACNNQNNVIVMDFRM